MYTTAITVKSAHLNLSIIVPLYNEEESLPLLYDSICAAIDPMGVDYEILLVNDGSSDNTYNVARDLAERDSKVCLIQFRSNYGQTPAMAAGIDHAQGQILVTMDGDLQNDPTDIPMMVEKLNEGFDIVVGWRYDRKDKLLSRKLPSVIANRLIAKVTGIPIKDNGCSLKVFRADLIKRVPFYNEMHRFIPALLSLTGARVAQVKVKHHARLFGESKYGLSRIYKVLLDLLTMKTILSLAQHPINWFGFLSLLPLTLFIFSFVLLLQNLLTDQSIVVIATTALLFFSASVFLIALGFICELIYLKGDVHVRDLIVDSAATSTKSGPAE